jgi:hypothetical protein
MKILNFFRQTRNSGETLAEPSGRRRRRKRDELLGELYPDTTYDRGRRKNGID